MSRGREIKSFAKYVLMSVPLDPWGDTNTPGFFSDVPTGLFPFNAFRLSLFGQPKMKNKGNKIQVWWSG